MPGIGEKLGGFKAVGEKLRTGAEGAKRMVEGPRQKFAKVLESHRSTPKLGLEKIRDTSLRPKQKIEMPQARVDALKPKIEKMPGAPASKLPDKILNQQPDIKVDTTKKAATTPSTGFKTNPAKPTPVTPPLPNGETAHVPAQEQSAPPPGRAETQPTVPPAASSERATPPAQGGNAERSAPPAASGSSAEGPRQVQQTGENQANQTKTPEQLKADATAQQQEIAEIRKRQEEGTEKPGDAKRLKALEQQAEATKAEQQKTEEQKKEDTKQKFNEARKTLYDKNSSDADKKNALAEMRRIANEAQGIKPDPSMDAAANELLSDLFDPDKKDKTVLRELEVEKVVRKNLQELMKIRMEVDMASGNLKQLNEDRLNQDQEIKVARRKMESERNNVIKTQILQDEFSPSVMKLAHTHANIVRTFVGAQALEAKANQHIHIINNALDRNDGLAGFIADIKAVFKSIGTMPISMDALSMSGAGVTAISRAGAIDG